MIPDKMQPNGPCQEMGFHHNINMHIFEIHSRQQKMGHNYHCTTVHFLYFWTPDKFEDLMYLFDDQHLFFTLQKVKLETYLSPNTR